MPVEDKKYLPHILSEEEIEMYLDGDRRAVDRLILYSINRLTAVIVPHTMNEEAREVKRDAEIIKIGGFEAIAKRAAYVDDMIKRREVTTLMMEKVSQSTLTWALIAFFGFLAMATWHEIVEAVKAALHIKGG